MIFFFRSWKSISICFIFLGSGSIWGLYSNVRLPKNQHGDIVSRTVCWTLPAVHQSWRQNKRLYLSHNSGKIHWHNIIMPNNAKWHGKRLICPCVCMYIQSWILQTIPLKDFMLQGLQEYIKKNNFKNHRNKSGGAI